MIRVRTMHDRNTKSSNAISRRTGKLCMEHGQGLAVSPAPGAAGAGFSPLNRLMSRAITQVLSQSLLTLGLEDTVLLTCNNWLIILIPVRKKVNKFDELWRPPSLFWAAVILTKLAYKAVLWATYQVPQSRPEGRVSPIKRSRLHLQLKNELNRKWKKQCLPSHRAVSEAQGGSR